ncbi:MAG: hypothetical protein C0619_15070 [Desulfuromonas sp.]|nr:MAG: hypothetical protein C0619_15070 [Desulfuromonas sp.]
MRVSRRCLYGLLTVLCLLLAFSTAYGWTPVPVKQDPHVRMPGTQPAPENDNDIESPTRCTNCHGGFNPAVEPAFNWQGSMMAQASRDFLFWACMTTAAQDSIWAVGNPNATDICERCHFPKGWIEGRSDPTNASLMTGADFDGVHCDVCHSMYDPFFESTFAGTREGSDWTGYWDEATLLSADAALATYLEDERLAAGVKQFNDQPFFINNQAASSNYDESGSGQMFLDDVRGKRASFADASARHDMFYSRYHKSKYMCSTCHDVSNPVLANLGQDGTAALTTETDAAYSYYHVERTFSEFMLSDYGQQGGALGIGPFSPDVFNTSQPGNAIAACQDCHMRDGVGPGASQRDAVFRPTESTDHPNSGQPIHDLTGGNAWVSTVLASAVNGSPNYNATNDNLLNQGAAVLTLDMGQGLGIDAEALLAGADRAMQQLELAASINNLNYNASNGTLSFQVQNQTGHKLISGFPEGRRMFLNIKGYDSGGGLVFEVNPYDYAAGTLKGLSDIIYDGKGLPDPTALVVGNEVYDDALVYEMKPTSALTGEDKTFHFALATGRYKDNRIPPKGFRIADAAARISVPVDHGVDAPNLYSSAEYAGGYDDVSIVIPTGLAQVDVTLNYQTTSREYIEFLREEINGYQNNTPKQPTLFGETGAGGDAPYLVQTDPFFSGLKAWGDTIWQLWLNNMNVTTAAPYVMASASVGGVPSCNAPTPTLLSATPSSSQVELSWSDESGAGAISYNLYYDQAGKAQFITSTDLTSHSDTGLTNGLEYCYKVTSSDGTCESGFSNILCATPDAPGQTQFVGASLLTGLYETSGKGKNQVTVFVEQTSFAAGDEITVRATVTDGSTGLPVPSATVTIVIGGPETATLTTGPSDVNGLAEATWNTQAPNKKGNGGTTPGSYTASTADVVATGYTWDGAANSIPFTLL